METQSLVAQTQAPRQARDSGSGRVCLVTAVTRDRISRFRDFELGCLAASSLTAPELWRDARLLCWVLMPDHLHLLMSLGENADLPRLVRAIKGRISRQLNLAIGRRGPFWQAGFEDHALPDEVDPVSVARYLIAHPVRAGLVARVGDYPFWNAIWLPGSDRCGTPGSEVSAAPAASLAPSARRSTDRPATDGVDSGAAAPS
jgi:REP element-mobilizing transposase RayT